MNDRFHYDALVDDALRSVVRRVLRQVADKGLPGSHHFYISFRSTDPGVKLPDYLRAKYPEEMTIVLQHRYWDLKVEDDFFSVGLSFGGVPSTLVVPFASVTRFHDPAVEFSLTFQADGGDDLVEEPDEAENDAPRADPGDGSNVVSVDFTKKK